VRINENNLDLIGKNFGIVPEEVLPPPAAKRTDGTDNNQFQKQQHLLKVPRNFTLLNFVGQLRDRNLVLDFSLINDPFVSQVRRLVNSIYSDNSFVHSLSSPRVP
jgi:hypothetical protein